MNDPVFNTVPARGGPVSKAADPLAASLGDKLRAICTELDEHHEALKRVVMDPAFLNASSHNCSWARDRYASALDRSFTLKGAW